MVVDLVVAVVVEEEKPWAERRGGEEREEGGQDRTAEAKIRPRERKQAKLNPTQAIQSKTIHKTRRQAGGFNPWTAAQLKKSHGLNSPVFKQLWTGQPSLNQMWTEQSSF